MSKLFDGVEDLAASNSPEESQPIPETETTGDVGQDIVEPSMSTEPAEDIVLDPETEKFRLELLERAKKAFTDVKEHTFKLYFVPTLKSAKDFFPIETSSLKPDGYTLLSGSRMDEAYYEQLKKTLYSENEKVDEEGLITLLTLYRQFKTNNYPVAVKTHQYRKFTRQFAMGLNYLFNRDELMLRNIYILFFSNSSLKELEGTADVHA